MKYSKDELFVLVALWILKISSIVAVFAMIAIVAGWIFSMVALSAFGG